MDIIIKYYRLCSIQYPPRIEGKLDPKYYVNRDGFSYPKESIIGGDDKKKQKKVTNLIICI